MTFITVPGEECHYLLLLILLVGVLGTADGRPLTTAGKEFNAKAQRRQDAMKLSSLRLCALAPLR